MKLYQFYYDNDGEEQSDLVAAETRPSDEEAIAHLNAQYGHEHITSIDIYEVSTVDVIGTQYQLPISVTTEKA